MTPAARVQAAITLLDLILSGESAEKTLIRWGRQNRYAGSKDRAAIRDWVYDALRCRRSYAALGGAETGRALLIAALRRQNLDPQDYFTAEGYAPSLLAPEEGKAKAHISAAEQADLPDWLWPIWQQDLGADAAPVAENLRARAPVFLRVNL
ncbi:MAG: RsmB/NOP family class I SAM-dependent RNA methyltransferase, partial [Paracoccaceae bacterium]